MAERVVAGLIEDHKLTGTLCEYPEDAAQVDGLVEIPSEDLCDLVVDMIVKLVPEGTALDAVGVALPGIVRNGIIEDSPNLGQMKGAKIGEWIVESLQEHGRNYPVGVFNDADAVAAGLAATKGQLDRLVRVWTIGNGIGYGRWPYVEGVWEGGHVVVTLDPKERFCGCGGVGHLEGIMGYRAMRMRFLDLEPEEVFAQAKHGDTRCREFVDLWHRALAAGTASFIHLAGPGRFYFTGHNVGFLDLTLLRGHLETMVKMSPLLSYSLEILPPDDETALIGAGVSAVRALTW
jgi:glucokinase